MNVDKAVVGAEPMGLPGATACVSRSAAVRVPLPDATACPSAFGFNSCGTAWSCTGAPCEPGLPQLQAVAHVASDAE